MIHTRYGPFGGYSEPPRVIEIPAPDGAPSKQDQRSSTRRPPEESSIQGMRSSSGNAKPQVVIERIVADLRLLAKTLTPGCFFDKHTVGWANELDWAILEHYGFAIDNHGELQPGSEKSTAGTLLQTSLLLKKIQPGFSPSEKLKEGLIEKADVLEELQRNRKVDAGSAETAHTQAEQRLGAESDSDCSADERVLDETDRQIREYLAESPTGMIEDEIAQGISRGGGTVRVAMRGLERGGGDLPGVSRALEPEHIRVAGRPSLFISYSHKDELFRNELDGALMAYKCKGELAVWDDTKIVPGQKWELEILGKLERADIIVLLLSNDFIRSDYCIQKEMKRAIERDHAGECAIIPIVVRPCRFDKLEVGQTQAILPNGKAIKQHKDRDAAWLDVTKQLDRVLADLKKRQRTGPAAEFLRVQSL